MIRVKLIKEKVWSHELNDWEYKEEGENVGKVFDAFKTKGLFDDDEEKTTYHLDMGDGIYFADAEQVEELDPSLDYSDEDGVLKLIRENNEMQSPQFTRVSTQPKKVLLVEDGSVDIDNLEEWCNNQNIKLIVYRQGANKPEIIDI